MANNDLLVQLQTIVPNGSVNKFTLDKDFLAPFSLKEYTNHPSYIIQPANESELGELIKYANEHGLNLVVSSSKNFHRRGGITNNQPHLLVDLSNWKKIDLIDRRNRVCRVEPGVT